MSSLSFARKSVSESINFEQRSRASSLTDFQRRDCLQSTDEAEYDMKNLLCRLMTSKICIIVLSFYYSLKIFPTEKHVYLKQCKVPIFTTIGRLSSHGDDDKVNKPLVL